MKTKLIYWLAIVLLVQAGLIHLFLAQTESEEALYLGYLFVANFFGAALAAYLIYRRQVWGWFLGLAVMAGSLAGYTWSRTLGMPGMNVEEWFSPYGIIALVLEAAFLVLVLLRPWQRPPADLAFSASYKYVFPAAGWLAILLISGLAYQWDAAQNQPFGMHVGTFEQVLQTRPASMAEVQEKYGIQVSLAAASMMNSIIDVRLKILDPDKAHAFLQNQAAILVGDQALILAPHMHSHTITRLKEGKNFVLFFPSQNIITRGTQVSLVFGSVRLEAVVVR